MKGRQIMRIVLIILCMVVLLPAAFPGRAFSIFHKPDVLINENNGYVANLPASLLSVESEAFSGTSIGTVVFQNRLVLIADRAFWNAAYLNDVYIPKSTVFIGKNAFPDNVLIYGVKSSYAQKWAKENGIEFVSDDIWNTRAATYEVHTERLLIVFYILFLLDIRIIKEDSRKADVFTKSMRPQDRPELYPINYRFP